MLMKLRNSLFLFCLSMSAMLSGCAEKTMIIAHRGSSAIAPENTLAAVCSAWRVNSDAVEVDVHLTADNRIAVIHDTDTQRVSNEKLVVSKSTFEQISQLDVGSHKSWNYRDEKIPELKKVISTIPESKKLFIEIKCSQKILPHLKRLIKNSDKVSQLVLISFNLDTLTQAKKQLPKIPAYWLVSPRKNEKTGKYLPYSSKLIIEAKSRNLDGLNANYGL